MKKIAFQFPGWLIFKHECLIHVNPATVLRINSATVEVKEGPICFGRNNSVFNYGIGTETPGQQVQRRLEEILELCDHDLWRASVELHHLQKETGHWIANSETHGLIARKIKELIFTDAWIQAMEDSGFSMSASHEPRYVYRKEVKNETKVDTKKAPAKDAGNSPTAKRTRKR